MHRRPSQNRARPVRSDPTTKSAGQRPHQMTKHLMPSLTRSLCLLPLAALLLGGCATQPHNAGWEQALRPSGNTANDSQAACATIQCCRHAAAVVTTVAAAHKTMVATDGGSVPVRRGIMVNRNPTAKHIMKPWICTME